MSCETIQHTLFELGCGSADRERIARALKHLDECATCREAVADLDTLRGAFAAGSEEPEPAGGWDAFERRLAGQVYASPGRSWRRVTMALAASLLIAGTAFEFGRIVVRSVVPLQVATTGASAAGEELGSHFTPGDITHEVNAFHQVSQVLDGRAGWMLVSDKASDVGVADGALDTGKVLLLRFTVLADGGKVSEADLVSIPGQTANLTVPLEAGTTLHYRVGTSIDEPTRLSLWAEIRTPSGAEPLAALSTDLRMQSGEKRTAGELSTSAGKYVLNVGFARASFPSGVTP